MGVPAMSIPHRTLKGARGLDTLSISGTAALVGDLLIALGGATYLAWSLSGALETHWGSALSKVLLTANGCIALFGIMYTIRKQQPLFAGFFCFNWMFLAVAPLQQIGVGYWDPVFRRDALVLEAVEICLLFNLMGLAFALTRKYRTAALAETPGYLDRSLLESRSAVLLLLVTATITIGLMAFYGSAMFTNREEFSTLIQGSTTTKSTAILVRSFLNPLAFVGSLVGLVISYRRRSPIWMLFAFVLIGAALVNNPIVQPRYRSSTLLMFALLVAFGVRRIRLIVWFILFGVAASPIYNSLFRYNTYSADIRKFGTFFVHMDFDALDIFCYTILWVHNKGLEWGGNLLGAALFFIPRTVWKGKSLHLAAIIYDYLRDQGGFTIDNLSSPPPAEGYLSFGVAGAIGMSFVTVYAIDWVERRGLSAELYSAWHLILCLSPMLMIILLRGPLQVGFSEWVIHSLTVATVAVVLGAGGRRRVRVGASAAPQAMLGSHVVH